METGWYLDQESREEDEELRADWHESIENQHTFYVPEEFESLGAFRDWMDKYDFWLSDTYVAHTQGRWGYNHYVKFVQGSKVREILGLARFSIVVLLRQPLSHHKNPRWYIEVRIGVWGLDDTDIYLDVEIPIEGEIAELVERFKVKKFDYRLELTRLVQKTPVWDWILRTYYPLPIVDVDVLYQKGWSDD